jgi:hypothetical protein
LGARLAIWTGRKPCRRCRPSAPGSRFATPVSAFVERGTLAAALHGYPPANLIQVRPRYRAAAACYCALFLTAHRNVVIYKLNHEWTLRPRLGGTSCARKADWTRSASLSPREQWSEQLGEAMMAPSGSSPTSGELANELAKALSPPRVISTNVRYPSSAPAAPCGRHARRRARSCGSAQPASCRTG